MIFTFSKVDADVNKRIKNEKLGVYGRDNTKQARALFSMWFLLKKNEKEKMKNMGVPKKLLDHI